MAKIPGVGISALMGCADIDRVASAPGRSCQLPADGDHHLGYAVPIGGVVAYRNAISPSGVGFDIGCGNKAVLTDANLADVRSRIAPIMDEVWRVISFGVGRKNKERVESEVLDDAQAWAEIPGAIRGLKDLAAAQLGTVGSGNHSRVDLFADEKDRVWWVSISSQDSATKRLLIF